MAEDPTPHRPEAAGFVASSPQSHDRAPAPPDDPPAGAAPPGESAPTPAIPADEDAAPHPDFATDAEHDAYWRGMAQGIRVGGGAVEDETRKLRYRTDGWTPERQRSFLIVLSVTGSVKDACEEVGMSRESAYRLRRKPEGRLFARLWDAARLIARDRLADEAMERAVHGTEETLVYHGEQVGSRWKHDNRHLQWTLGRLDRETEGYGENAAPARRAAQAFDALVDTLAENGDMARSMLDDIDREAEEARQARQPDTVLPDDFDFEEGLARLRERDEIEAIGRMDPAEVDISDLDPMKCEQWSTVEWERADRSGLVARLEDAGFWDEDKDEKQAAELAAAAKQATQSDPGKSADFASRGV